MTSIMGVTFGSALTPPPLCLMDIAIVATSVDRSG